MRDKLNSADDAGEDDAQVYIVVRPKAVRGDQVVHNFLHTQKL